MLKVQRLTKSLNLLEFWFLDFWITSLVHAKMQGQEIFGVIFLIVNRFLKFLWHFLRLLECKGMVRSHFARSVSEQGDMEKAVSKIWCKESND